MDSIDRDQFDSVEIEDEEEELLLEEPQQKLTFEDVIKTMDSPIDIQKELAAKVKVYVDNRMKHELSEKGKISQETRKWVELLNGLLEKMHKEMFGDKSTSMNLHIVSHSDISSKLRKLVIE